MESKVLVVPLGDLENIIQSFKDNPEAKEISINYTNGVSLFVKKDVEPNVNLFKTISE